MPCTDERVAARKLFSEQGDDLHRFAGTVGERAPLASVIVRHPRSAGELS